jgi:hypothetical protein
MLLTDSLNPSYLKQPAHPSAARHTRRPCAPLMLPLASRIPAAAKRMCTASTEWYNMSTWSAMGTRGLMKDVRGAGAPHHDNLNHITTK